MRFTYTYRSSDGERHTAEIEAESRDAAFAKIRSELGIKPIKVTATGDAGESQPPAPGKRFPVRVLPWAVGIVFAVVGVVYWLWSARSDGSSEVDVVVMHTPQGPVTLQAAEPLPRQMIPGNRQRIEGDRDSVFTNAAERLLSRFAEPGRAVAASADARPSEAEFRACLREPIRVASSELTEHIDLKRIVSGMKREMRAYIAGGGTIDGYLAELEKRQKLEVSYRERAEQKLNDMLNGLDARSPGATGGTPVVPDAAKMAAPHTGGASAIGQDARGRDSLKAAYAYWLKANASLKSMGIYELPLPDALRSYQMSLDIDE